MEDGLAVALQKRVDTMNGLLHDLQRLKDDKSTFLKESKEKINQKEEQLFELSNQPVNQTEINLDEGVDGDYAEVGGQGKGDIESEEDANDPGPSLNDRT